MLRIDSHAGAVSFPVRVHPGSRREGVAGLYGDALKIGIHAPSVDGRANQALVRALAALLGVPRPSVQIVSGLTSRSKIVRVLGMSAQEVEAKLTQTEAV